jgi:mannose-6-phosphate isomerase
VQHYNWGGHNFIPQLLNTPNNEGLPFAEYWLGAHPNFSSFIDRDGQSVPLPDFIKTNREEVLGRNVAGDFDALPFLFKVLDVKQMLSIQVHPDLKEAKIGFDKENREGIPITAAHRNYKDENHKPEQMVALSDFWLLHGFKSPEKLTAILHATPELLFLKKIFVDNGYDYLYRYVMTMEQGEVNGLLHPLAERILPLYRNGLLQKDREDFWAARAIVTFSKGADFDRGLFSIYFFNLLQLKKGEGIFQPAGMPHAYLEGQNIEVMANSDNVLRGGLTEKYIDVEELMKHTNFSATVPDILYPDADGLYVSPAKEFCLYRYINKSAGLFADGAEIIFVLKGKLSASNGLHQLNVSQGEAVFVMAGTYADLVPDGETEFYRVSIPGA